MLSTKKAISMMIAAMIAIAFSLSFTSQAFAATSIRYGWCAQDEKGQLILAGSKYTLESNSKVCPVKKITNGKTTVNVNADAVVYLSNTKVGQAQALIIGSKIPGYKDAFITTFGIVAYKATASKPTTSVVPPTPQSPKSIAAASITIADQTYTGKPLTPKPTVKLNGKTLKLNTDYTVSYSNNVKLGHKTAKVTITGKGNYTGKITKAFNIVKKNLSDAKITGLSKQYWTNGVDKVKPSITVTYKGKKVAKSNYTISYSKNIKPGKASLTIKSKKDGEFAGSKTVHFELVNINDGIAEMACMLSYSHQHFYDPNSGKYAGTAAYKDAGGIRSCEKGPHYAFVRSGFRSVFRGGAKQSATHDSPSSWKIIGKYKSKYLTDGTLQPGDVLAGGHWHTFIYTGNEIQQKIYKKYIKGTDGDLGTPKKNYMFVSSHHGTNKYNTAAMCCCDAKWSLANSYGSSLTIYRLVKPDDSNVRHGLPVRKSSLNRIAKYQKKVAKTMKRK